MTPDNAAKNDAAARRLHEAYISKVNEAQEQDNDQRSAELADDYLDSLLGSSVR